MTLRTGKLVLQPLVVRLRTATRHVYALECIPGDFTLPQKYFIITQWSAPEHAPLLHYVMHCSGSEFHLLLIRYQSKVNHLKKQVFCVFGTSPNDSV